MFGPTKGAPSFGPLLFLVLLAVLGAGLREGAGGDDREPRRRRRGDAEGVRAVVPSVVAVLDDDRALREEEQKRAMEELGKDEHAPKNIIDVSLRKEPMPHGTGFLIAGGLVVTAAHVVLSPDHIKLTTRAGETVDAELVEIEEVRSMSG